VARPTSRRDDHPRRAGPRSLWGEHDSYPARGGESGSWRAIRGAARASELWARVLDNQGPDTLTDGDYIDSLAPAGLDSSGVLLSLGAARERGGLYRVEILHDGYTPWQQADVLVREDECHVHTVTLRAQLSPVP
jgi:hypothetical protein